jgi:hypothetical protein
MDISGSSTSLWRFRLYIFQRLSRCLTLDYVEAGITYRIGEGGADMLYYDTVSYEIPGISAISIFLPLLTEMHGNTKSVFYNDDFAF